jgi:hypothetical protein
MKQFWIFDFGFSIERPKSKKVFYLAPCAILFALCVSAQAQQPGKIPRIGYLSGTGFGTGTTEGFRRGLRDLGYIEGKNILIEYRDTGATQDLVHR